MIVCYNQRDEAEGVGIAGFAGPARGSDNVYRGLPAIVPVVCKPSAEEADDGVLWLQLVA